MTDTESRLYRRTAAVSVSMAGMINSEYNRKKSHEVASLLFPSEEWIFKEPNIYVAKSRLAEERWEPENCIAGAMKNCEE